MALRSGVALLRRSITQGSAARVLPVAARRTVFTTPVSWTAETASQDASQEGELEKLAEPETVGWGSTRMEDLLREKMAQANAGSLLVFDPSKIDFATNEGKHSPAASDAVVGIITERDYLTKVVVKGKQSTSTRISDIMTPSDKLVTVTPKHSVLDVMELMVNKNFRHVPVVDNGVMLGMASMRDVVHIMLKEHREEVGRLQEYIQGTF